MFSLAVAREVRRTFFGANDPVEIWGLGLHSSLLGIFEELAAPPTPHAGFAPVGAGGVYAIVTRARTVLPDGSPLGHELLTYDGSFNSAASLHFDEEKLFLDGGVTTNRHGLI